jgi:AcrR family transcriptional regulator
VEIEPLSLRERKKLARKERIEQAALELFHKNGFERTTVEEIAALADVGKGTFFNYFPTKEAVLLALGERQMARLQETIVRDLSDSALDPAAQLKRLFETLGRALEAEERPELVRLTVFETLRRPELLGQDRNRIRLHSLLKTLVERGQGTGQIRADIEAKVVAQALEGSYFQQVFEWCANPNAFSLTDRLRDVVELIVQGAATRK